MKFVPFFQAAAAFFIWSLMGLFLNLSSLTPFQSVWSMNIVGLACLFLYAFFFGRLKAIRTIQINRYFFIFLAASGFSGVLWMWALTKVPIAQAVLLFNTSPLFTLLAAYFFLKEALTKEKLFAVLIGLVGVGVLLSGGLSGSIYLVGAFAIFAAAMLNGLKVVFTKHFSFSYPLWLTIGLILAAQVIVATPFAFSEVWIITPVSVLYTILLGVFAAVLGFWFFVTSLRKLDASSVMLVAYIEPVLAAVWGYMFLNQQMTVAVALGGIIILVAGYLAVHMEAIKKKV